MNWGCRSYPATALILLGAVLTARGVRGMPGISRGPMDMLAWVRGFRRAVAGIAVAGVGAAWLWHEPWLLAFALVFGVEEVWESSVILSALESDRRCMRS